MADPTNEKRILLGGIHNPVDDCSFCGANPTEYKHLFVAPTGATMCDNCQSLIHAAMHRPEEEIYGGG